MQVGGWGHLGVFGVIGGQNSNIFKPRQFIYQNEALGHVIMKKLFLRSPDPKLGVKVQKSDSGLLEQGCKVYFKVMHFKVLYCVEPFLILYYSIVSPLWEYYRLCT